MIRAEPLRVGVQLLELIDGPVLVFRGCVMLDQHHRHVVAFLRVRHADERTGRAFSAQSGWSSSTQSQT